MKLTRLLQRGYVRLKDKHFGEFVFIHINKTAGSSIEKALHIPFEHRTALKKRQELGQKRWDSRFKFAFVRNPWDKVVSHFHFRVKTNQTGLADANQVPFTEWVKLAYGENDPRYYDKPLMFAPQMEWVTDEQGKIIVDFIGRFENLEADFAEVCKRIGRDASLPHLKSSKRGNYREHYDDEAAEVVRKWFAKDIAEFGYEY